MSDGGLWSRDGHLHELALFRAFDGELSPGESAAVEAHVASCESCRSHLAALRAEVARPLPELRLPEAEIIPFPARMRAAAPGLATLLSLAAVMLIYLRPPEAGERFAVRGGALSLEVYRAAQPRSERLRTGDVVAAGDRLAFRVVVPEGGQLLVFGVDGSGQRYPVWPGDPGLRSQAVLASVEPRELDVGLELDAAPGEEHIVAMRCPTPFGAADLPPVSDGAGSATLPPGCSMDEVVLSKGRATR